MMMKHRGLWALMPMRVEMAEKAEEDGAVFQEVVFSSVKGCPWRGELRVSAAWKKPSKGEALAWSRPMVRQRF